MESLKTKWQQLSQQRNWPEVASSELWLLLNDYYQNEKRYYHNLNHVADCLRQLADRYSMSAADYDCLVLAVWFHDVIYETDRRDNELKSAEFARQQLQILGESKTVCDAVARLIVVTDHQTELVTPQEELLVDIDLSILGSAPDRYLQYSNAIRNEYGWVNDEDYIKGRLAVLKNFTERPRIFRTPGLWKKYEQQARDNLAGEMKSLRLFE